MMTPVAVLLAAIIISQAFSQQMAGRRKIRTIQDLPEMTDKQKNQIKALRSEVFYVDEEAKIKG